MVLWSCAVLLSSAISGASQVKLVSPGFTSFQASAELTRFASDHFAQQLALNGLRVITADEISQVVGFEKQKQLLGCKAETSSCLTELANALGVDGIISGSIGRFEGTYQVNIKIISAEDAHQLAVMSATVDGEKALMIELTAQAKRLAPEVLAALHREPVKVVPLPPVSPPPDRSAGVAATERPASSPSVAPSANRPASTSDAAATASAAPDERRWNVYAAVPAVVGVGAVALGTLWFLQANADLGQLRDGTPQSYAAASAIAQDGARLQTQGFIAMGLGVVCLAGAAAAQVLYPGATPFRAAILPAPGGGALVLSGAFR